MEPAINHSCDGVTEYERLDVLLHCAGVCGLPFSVTSDGLELTMATNHFGKDPQTTRCAAVVLLLYGEFAYAE